MNDLSAAHLKMLHESAISDEVISQRGYRTVDAKSRLRELGFGQTQAHVPALVIPIYGPTGALALYQARPDVPRIKDGRVVKYETPRGSKMVLDVHPLARHLLGVPKVPLFVTEGVKKEDAIVSRGDCAIGLLGVWNFRGMNEHGGKTILADWEYIALEGRRVYIVFDSDVMTNPQVHGALVRLSSFLRQRGAM